jgi:serine/threonine protein phosphatase PrpC
MGSEMKIDLRVLSIPKSGRKLIGARSEDAFAHTSFCARPFVAVVADGHGDPEVNTETYLLARSVAQQLRDHTNLPEWALCQSINQNIVSRFSASKAGAVATRVKMTENELTVLFVGDCRLYRFTPSRACAFEQLTEDHHPDHPGEYGRLFPCVNPQVKNSPFLFLPLMGTPSQLVRVFKDEFGKTHIRGLRVTRSFGDPEMSPLVIPVPEVKTIPIESSKRHLFALCSDGGAGVVERVFSSVQSRPGILLDEMHHIMCCRTPPEPDDDTTIMLIEVLPT